MAYNGQSLASQSARSGEANLRHASNLLQKKKQLHPIHNQLPNHPYRASSFYGNNYTNNKSHVSAFTQRIMSAKLLRVKQLQNQLKEYEIRMHELLNENRLLRTLQKRQDTALKRHEGDQAQLPQLIKSHNEEIRVLTTKFKQLKASYREKEQKLRQREVELSNLKEQHRHLLQLSRDKNLGLRERLTKEVEDLQYTIREQNERIQLLTRRVELEGKNNRHQLALEINRHRDTQTELTMALETIENLKNLVEAKEKYINSAIPKRFYRTSAPTLASTGSSHTRFHNLPKTAGSVPTIKQDSEESNVVSIVHPDQETDTMSQGSSNQTYNHPSSRQIVESGINFRKKLASRKSRSKVSLRSINPVQGNYGNENENNVETPAAYSSNFPSINTSDENSSKFHTSESEAVTTKANSILKDRRRMSIDSAVTTGGNNSNDSSDNINVGKKERSNNRRKSVSICESNDPAENDIGEALVKAQSRDRLQRQKSIKDELKELEEKLKLHHKKYPLQKNDSVDSLYEQSTDPKKMINDKKFEALYEQKSMSVKDELKEFEARLLNSDFNSSSIIKSFEEQADEVVRKVTKELEMPSLFDNEEESVDEEKLREKFGLPKISSQWNEMRRNFHSDQEQTEALLDKYYSVKNKNKNTKLASAGGGESESQKDEDDYDEGEEDDDGREDNIEAKDEEQEKLILNENTKARLLKALHSIDRHDKTSQGRTGSRINNFKFSDSSNESVNEDKKIFPVLENLGKQDTEDYNLAYDGTFVKTKSDLMDELFGGTSKVSIFKPERESITETRADENS